MKTNLKQICRDAYNIWRVQNKVRRSNSQNTGNANGKLNKTENATLLSNKIVDNSLSIRRQVFIDFAHEMNEVEHERLIEYIAKTLVFAWKKWPAGFVRFQGICEDLLEQIPLFSNSIIAPEYRRTRINRI